MFKEIYPRVSAWNEARYPRVYDKNLGVSLIKEEFEEWADAVKADNDIDKIDALCDMIYVAMGIIWKVNAPQNQVDYFAHQAHRTVSELIIIDSSPGFFISTYFYAYGANEEYPTLLFAHLVIQTACVELFAMGFNESQVTEALNIVCDSNDSKAVKRTDPNVKANVDKGADFIPPEPRLTDLWERVNATHH